jgi:uncharacterized membrane protein
MASFLPLAVLAAMWFAIHPGIAGSGVRGRLVRRVGEPGFRGIFSLLSAVTLTGLIWSYAAAPVHPLWLAPRAAFHVPLLVVPVAFVLLAGAFTVPNPTAVAAEHVLARPDAARGVLRITRHPFLWAILLWSTSHLLVNGDVASLLFFGSFAATALVGTFDIDAKRRRADPQHWERYRAVTSNVPFAAILTRQNQLVLRELALPIALGAVLTVVLIHFHASWFGPSPLP